ncbi:MAG: ribosome biogenesis GTP-binding protein YihA/YsxC [Nevskiaceae bacterium]
MRKILHHGPTPVLDANPFSRARFLTSAARLEQLPPPDRPELAFAGRSNSGKSSALNALCGRRKLARVSRTPGRTQLLNFFELPEGRIVDLPGYGFARVPKDLHAGWGGLIEGYLASRECLRGLAVVMDARRPLTEFDRAMLGWARAQGLPCHLLLAKSDKLASGAARRTLREVQGELPSLHERATAQLFSAHAGTGVEEAREALARWLKPE